MPDFDPILNAELDGLIAAYRSVINGPALKPLPLAAKAGYIIRGMQIGRAYPALDAMTVEARYHLIVDKLELLAEETSA